MAGGVEGTEVARQADRPAGVILLRARGLSWAETATMPPMRAVWATVVAVITTAAVQAAQPVGWRIVSVHDGDTVTAVDPANTEWQVPRASL